jgi:hypothetical protein
VIPGGWFVPSAHFRRDQLSAAGGDACRFARVLASTRYSLYSCPHGEKCAIYKEFSVASCALADVGVTDG